MGSDLYNNLIRYFVVHLKALRDVRYLHCFVVASIVDSFDTEGRGSARRQSAQVLCRPNGSDTQQERTTSTGCSPTSTDIGSNVKGTKGERRCTRCILCVTSIYLRCISSLTCGAQLALVQWKNNLFVPIQQKNATLANALLHLIEQQRNGETIDQGPCEESRRFICIPWTGRHGSKQAVSRCL